MKKQYIYILILLILSSSVLALFDEDTIIIKKTTSSGTNITSNSFQCSSTELLYNISITSSGVLNGVCQPINNSSSSHIFNQPLYNVSNNVYWNNTLFYNKTEIDAQQLAQNNSINLKLDASSQIYNETSLINAVNTTANINALGFNITTQLNNLFYNINNPNNYYNSTTLPYQTSAGGWTNTSTSTSTNLNVIVNNSVFFANAISGNVGIGTASPGVKLDVAGVGRFQNMDLFTTNPTVDIGTNNGGGYFGFLGYDTTNNYVYLGHSYNSVYNKNLVISNTSNIGIGTITPAGKLHIYQGASGVSPVVQIDDLVIEGGAAALGISLLSSSSGGGETQQIAFGDTGAASQGLISFSHSTNKMGFGTNAAATNMIIDSSGRVGIGTTSPSQKLTVSGNINVSGTVYYGALVANSPHAFMGDSEFNYTRICMIAEDDVVVKQTIVYDTKTNSYVYKLTPNSADCLNKTIFKEQYDIENEENITTITVYQQLFSEKKLFYSNITKNKVSENITSIK